jgi:23S rRNA (pseudouridine1915-N3)-methyltransferase
MKVTVIAVGKLKERFWKDAVAEYAKRLSGYVKLSIVEVGDFSADRCGGEDAAREREAREVLAALPTSSRTILLAIDGKQYASELLAEHLDELKLLGCGAFTFIIGGSYGVAPSVRERADETLSFGKMTLPHNLARVVLLEQLYRCARISRGEPYHK